MIMTEMFFNCKTIVILAVTVLQKKSAGAKRLAIRLANSATNNKKLFRRTPGVMYAGSSINDPQYFARRCLSSVVLRLSCLTTERQGAGLNPTADVLIFLVSPANNCFYNQS
jgi:hypothetical protein